jgi:predicted dehydrogenase
MPKIAFVGAAHIHTPGFINSIKGRPDFTVKYVWDHDLARAEKNAAEIPGAKATHELNMIANDEEVTAVIVCTETNRHEEVVIPLAAAKKHLFVEKPLGFAGKDAYSMAAAIEKAGVLYSTGYFQRGDAKNNFIKKQIDAGAFGKITRVRGSNCHSGALGRWFDTDWRWMANPKIAGVGAFGDLGTHALDILLWWMGDVKSVTGQLDPGTAAYEGCDETGEGILRFANGTIGTLAAAWDDVADPVSYLISGTKGYAAVINGQLYFKSELVENAKELVVTDPGSGKPAGLDAFLDAVQGKEAVLVGVREAAYRSAVMEAIYTGAHSGKWVTPEKK